MTIESRPRFCWHCGRALASYAYHPGVPPTTVYDEIGNPHVVHQCCAHAAAPHHITAAPTPHTPYDSPKLHDE